jgi:hypothetical protein
MKNRPLQSLLENSRLPIPNFQNLNSQRPTPNSQHCGVETLRLRPKMIGSWELEVGS